MKPKLLLAILCTLLSSPGFSAGKFQTNFSKTDFIVVVILLVILAAVDFTLKSAIRSLKHHSGENNKAEFSDSDRLKLDGKTDDIVQVRSVFFYCFLLFIFFYTAYVFVRGTSMESHVLEWMNLVVRWMHVVFGIAWIGASFYFVFLENALNRTTNLKEGIAGNLWAIHGGGFYYLEKYKVAPDKIPQHLHWFKYEAYFTWLSGFTLLVIVYYLDAKVYLIDPNVMILTPGQGIAIGTGTLLVSWFVYDALCKSFLASRQVLLSIILLVFISFTAWFFAHVFSSRAAYIHVGALLGTLMAGNVFRVIIPGQKSMVRSAIEGKPVDPSIGKKALLRSLHNNYFTLPVIFIMISNHFPATYGSIYNWMILIGLTIASALIKHYLNLKEKGEKSVWILPVGIICILSLAFITRPVAKTACKDDSPATFTEVNAIIQERCVTCHSAAPTDDIIKVAPNGIAFDSKEMILRMSERINQRAVVTKTMPQANKTGMTEEERAVISCWIENGAKP